MNFSLVSALSGRFEWLDMDGGNVKRRVNRLLRLNDGPAFRL
jgi:hypothetical protein